MKKRQRMLGNIEKPLGDDKQSWENFKVVEQH
jgi:hypothetical protein